MASTPEGKVKDRIKALLKSHRVYYAMPIGSGYGISGIPDFLCCVSGKFLAIEAKAGKGQATALQLKALKSIEDAGGAAIIVRETDYADLEALIVAIKTGGRT